jgi:2-aminoadipate transaminase
VNGMFSDRITDVPRSFIREILKVAVDPSVISFAGGLPNRDLFPVDEIREAACGVLQDEGRDALQYASSEGDPGLRDYISARYRDRQGLRVPAESILITSGSQQGLDLLGKILLNDGDGVIMEEPGYLGAIQAFSVYRARFHPVPVSEEGLDVHRLMRVFDKHRPKLCYSVPNFQNPSGISYPAGNRVEVAKVLRGTGVLLIEDDPYGELRYEGPSGDSFRTLLPDASVLLGSFSKTVAPGLRLGWIAAPESIMDKLLIAKQATDLHTNGFAQKVLYRYLRDHDLDGHIEKIARVYDRQRRAMIDCIGRHLPPGVTHTRPEGGMFLWLTLPDGVSAMELFHLAIKEKVAFVPGDPFYVDGRFSGSLRLNFSCVDEGTIEEGMSRLGASLRRLLENRAAKAGGAAVVLPEEMG